jgi:YXWGXW repeat-containing protein
MGKAIAAAASVVLAALTLGTLGVGCVVEAGASGSIGGGVAVSGPPPEPMRETRPQPPDAQAVWVAGYWHWSGMQYTWIPGHWENAPPGASWHAPQYSIREGTYFYEPGSWSRRP